MGLLCEFVGLGGMFHGLPRKFVRGQMVFFVVMRSGRPVCVRGQIVKLRGSLMRILWHTLSPQ